MSKFKAVLGAVTSILGLGAPKIPSIPAPAVPAPPAPTRRTDTGASIVVGAEDVKNQRVSGSRKTSPRAGDVLGGLGRGSGISI